MKSKTGRIYIVLLFALLLWSCAVTDIDRSVNFSELRKFDWGKSEISVSHPLYKSDLIEKKIRNVVTAEFGKKGIAQDTKDPDFLVSYRTHTEKKKEQRPAYPAFFPYSFRGFYPYPFYGYFGYRFPAAYGFPGKVREYTEGTLILDILDADTGELVWRGSVSGNVDNAKNIQKQIEKGVRAILKKYPAVDPDEKKDILPQKDVIG
jgi:hypothetical protein